MFNQCILVGRLTKDPEVRTLDDGRNVTEITLALQKSFKNSETGLYDTDFINCTVWQVLAVNLQEFCKKGTVIGIKARLGQRKLYLDESKERYYNVPEVIAEKIHYISSK
ncbi:MAG: single-stranded DNA-binding protein [Erysipelotrichales bacterium]|nr:single-stranded DNA-binding protein [Erysipelotrichales bacterium]